MLKLSQTGHVKVLRFELSLRWIPARLLGADHRICGFYYDGWELLTDVMVESVVIRRLEALFTYVCRTRVRDAQGTLSRTYLPISLLLKVLTRISDTWRLSPVTNG